MTRILYVPTDRPCASAVAHGVTECADLRSATAEEYLFLLVEHGRRAEVPEHARVLRAAAQRARVPALHLTAPAWEAVLSRVVDAAGLVGDEASRVRAVLDPSGLTYGAGPNKAFLVAAALGVDVLHRRDSDVEPEMTDGRARYPGRLEVLAIGRPLREVPMLADRDSIDPRYLDRVVRFVGSTYYGDSPQDRRDILAAGLTHATRLQALTRPDGFPLAEVQRQVSRYFVDTGGERYAEDFFRFDTDDLASELGVSCVQGIFRDLPEMPLAETLGTDYRQRNALSQLDTPMLFQSRKVRHRYGADRVLSRPVDGLIRYSMRDLRLVLLWIASWRQAELVRAYRTNAELPAPRTGTLLDPAHYSELLERALDQTLEAIIDTPRRYAEIYRAAAADVDGEHAVRLASVADAAEKRGACLVAEVVDGIADYCWLSRRWPALIAAAPAAAPIIREIADR